MWTDEASGAYKSYSSIAEEGTSPRAHFIKKLFIFFLIFSAQLSVKIVGEDKCYTL